jgi:hypothetical protein
LLRHFLAALAYRTQKALRDAPDDFADFSPGNLVRTPKELVRHMTSVLGYARTFFSGAPDAQVRVVRPQALETLGDEVARLHSTLSDLSRHLEDGDPVHGIEPERLLQGPFSDAMTHAGQLALLRRLHGSPVRPENFVVADISPDNVSVDQPEPRAPKTEWPEEL